MLTGNINRASSNVNNDLVRPLLISNKCTNCYFSTVILWTLKKLIQKIKYILQNHQNVQILTIKCDGQTYYLKIIPIINVVVVFHQVFYNYYYNN